MQVVELVSAARLARNLRCRPWMRQIDERAREIEVIGQESMVDYTARIEDLNARHEVAQARLDDPTPPPESTET